MLARFVIRIVVNAIALWAAAALIPRMEFSGRFINLVALAVLFGLVNSLIRPIVKLLTLPLTFLTLGLFALVVNGLMLLITANFGDSLDFDGRFVQRLVAAVAATILISIISTLLSRVLPDE